MLITALQVTDYKRLRKVEITPDSDSHLVLLGGRNRQGKSSTLDALTAAFGGAKAIAADPVRHGAEEAVIYVELDGGRLRISRRVARDGRTQLDVRDPDGLVRRPQEVLDKLIGARFLDPLAFLRLPAKEQRAQLMRLIEGADRIEELNAKRTRAFDRRTEVGRELMRARGEIERLPVAEVGTPIDVAALAAEQRAFAEQQRAGDALVASRDAAVRVTQDAVRRRADNAAAIKALEEKLAQLRSADAVLSAEVVRCEEAARIAIARVDAAAASWKAAQPRRDQLDADLRRADAHNRAVHTAEAQLRRRSETQDTVDNLSADVEQLTAAIEQIDQRKAEILAAAKLPVDGLEIGDDGITLAGVPFAQASMSEQLRVALALAIAGSPGLHDVWIKDAAVLDDESLDLVAQHAAASGKRVWLERVGTADPGVIVIRDGEVSEP